MPAFAIQHVYMLRAQNRTDFIFNEDSLALKKIESDTSLAQYLKIESNRRVEDSLGTYLQFKVEELKNQLDKDTGVLSDISEIVGNKNFKLIVALGDTAIPVIINDLKSRPSTLVWALNFITGRKISNKSISIAEASKLWISWGEKQYFNI